MRPFIIADNQFITGIGISALLDKVGVESVSNAQNVQELDEQLSVNPDAVVVLDYSLFDFTSVKQMIEMKSNRRVSRWILFSDGFDETNLRNALNNDPSISVINKYDSEKTITEALLNAVKNVSYLSESVKQVLENGNPPYSEDTSVVLTASEKVVLREIAMGKTTKEIALERNVSFHTINSHRKNIFRKLQVNNLHDAIKYAIRTGIFDVTEYYI